MRLHPTNYSNAWLYWLCGCLLLLLSPFPAQAAPTTAPKPRRAQPPRNEPVKQRTAPKKVPLPQLQAYGGKRVHLSALLALAKQAHPGIRRMRRMVQVLKQRQKRAGPWPDLMVGITGSNFPLNSFNPTQTPMAGIEYTISQRFPILRRLSIQRKLAAFDTKMMGAMIQEKLAGVRFKLQRALIELVYLQRALANARAQHALLVQAAAVAKTRYIVSKAPQQHMLQALTGQTLLRNQMTVWVSKAQVWRHKLALWTGQGAASHGLPSMPKVTSIPSAAMILSRALRNRGASQRWVLASQKAKLLLAFAKVRYWPDVTVSLSVRQRFPNPVDSGVPFLSLGIKVPLPTWGNAARHGLVKEAMALHVYARSRRKELKARWLAAAKIGLTQVQQYTQQRQIIVGQTIPLALQTYRSALANYQVGRVPFLTLMANLQEIFRQKRKVDRLDANRAIARSRLQAIAGVVK